MTHSITETSISRFPIPAEVANRRFAGAFATLRGDVEELARSCHLQDDLTTHSLVYLRNFERGSLRQGIEAILNRFNAALKGVNGLLRDPLSPPPLLLSQKALLGSDGKTYSEETLAIALSNTAPELRHRSPCSGFQDPALFTVRPHPVAARLVKWLIDFSDYPFCREIEQEYAALATRMSIYEGESPLLFQALTARDHVYIEQQLHSRVSLPIASLNAQLGRIQQLYVRVAARNTERAREIHAIGTAALSESQNIARETRLEDIEETLREEIERTPELRERVENLHGLLNRVEEEQEITEAHMDHLEQEIQATMAAVKKRNKDQGLMILQSIALTAACIAITQLLPGGTFIANGTPGGGPGFTLGQVHAL